MASQPIGAAPWSFSSQWGSGRHITKPADLSPAAAAGGLGLVSVSDYSPSRAELQPSNSPHHTLQLSMPAPAPSQAPGPDHRQRPMTEERRGCAGRSSVEVPQHGTWRDTDLVSCAELRSSVPAVSTMCPPSPSGTRIAVWAEPKVRHETVWTASLESLDTQQCESQLPDLARYCCLHIMRNTAPSPAWRRIWEAVNLNIWSLTWTEHHHHHAQDPNQTELWPHLAKFSFSHTQFFCASAVVT